jgi:Tetracyclin repressor-like, C-terminal domain
VSPEFAGPDGPLLAASTRVITSIVAGLRGYGIGEDEMDHVIRTIRSTIHGFVILDASRGFQWNADLGESFDCMIRFLDRGLRR